MSAHLLCHQSFSSWLGPQPECPHTASNTSPPGEEFQPRWFPTMARHLSLPLGLVKVWLTFPKWKDTSPSFVLNGHFTWRRPPGGEGFLSEWSNLLNVAWRRQLEEPVWRMMNFWHMSQRLKQCWISRPLSYIAWNFKEPSHLLFGYRVLSLLDPFHSDDPDYNESPKRMNHLIKTFEKYWKHWKKEYLLELREFHRTARTARELKTLSRRVKLSLFMMKDS